MLVAFLIEWQQITLGNKIRVDTKTTFKLTKSCSIDCACTDRTPDLMLEMHAAADDGGNQSPAPTRVSVVCYDQDMQCAELQCLCDAKKSEVLKLRQKISYESRRVKRDFQKIRRLCDESIRAKKEVKDLERQLDEALHVDSLQQELQASAGVMTTVQQEMMEKMMEDFKHTTINIGPIDDDLYDRSHRLLYLACNKD
jgi:hypothetical protein